MTATIDIPVSRPLLPTAARLLPYLEALDKSRRYANRGDLVTQLEHRLEATLNLRGVRLVTAASGTAALQAAILAAAGRAAEPRRVALVAGYTFAATPLAAEGCGYDVEFVDLSGDDWCIAPDAVRAHPSFARCGVVVPVAPYGMACRQRVWKDFVRSTDIPVVIDAAASFDAIRRDPAGLTGSVPVALSFHATKAFSTGEGGAVIWSDIAGLSRVVQACNFGILKVRETRSHGFNGKLSEYHAAVGLASLDGLEERDQQHATVAAAYRAAADHVGISRQIIVAPAIAPNYALFEADTGESAILVREALTRAGVDSRFWYGKGPQCEPYFRGRTGAALPNTEALAARLIGVPMFPDMSEHETEHVCATIAAVCHERRSVEA